MDTGIRKFVVFWLGSEEYGLPIEKVRSVIRYEEPTPVPRSPEGVDGVINLRGQVVPVVDLARRLLGTPSEITAVTRIVVVENRQSVVGLIVDRAREVTAFSEDDIVPPPDAILTSETADAIDGVVSRDGRLVILLDLEHALPEPDVPASATTEGRSDV